MNESGPDHYTEDEDTVFNLLRWKKAFFKILNYPTSTMPGNPNGLLRQSG